MNETRVTTDKVRLSYVHLFKPFAKEQGQEPKFSVTILLPKSDTATKSRIDAAIEAAKQKGTVDKWNGVCPPIVDTPIHDGDGVRRDGTPYGPECKGHWVFTATSRADRPIEVVDANLNPIIDQTQIYSGIYGRVSVNFAAYYNNGNKGIGCYLGPVQKLSDGEVLGGGTITAAEAFGTPVQQSTPAQPQAPAYGQTAPTQSPAPVYGQTAPVQPQAPAYGQTAPVQPQAPAYAQPAVDPITGLPM